MTSITSNDSVRPATCLSRPIISRSTAETTSTEATSTQATSTQTTSTRVTPQSTPSPAPKPQLSSPMGTPALPVVTTSRPNSRNSHQTGGSHRDSKHVQPFRSFLRAVGLKIFISRRQSKQPPEKCNKKENPKIIVSPSRLIAFTRAGVHILPITITLFLLLFNGIELLNGPDMTTTALFGLQVAAKFHVSFLYSNKQRLHLLANPYKELTIVGSLTSISLDLLRYHLLNEGVNIGLLGSALSVGSPSWFWSIDFISGVKTLILIRPKFSFTSSSVHSLLSNFVRSKAFLFAVLISCTLLATTVGPASALLFIPIQLWIRSSRTDFYIRGTKDELWPETLNRNHTGPDFCSISPLPTDIASCLNGAWRALVSAVGFISPTRPLFSFYIAGGSPYTIPPATIITGSAPLPKANYTDGFPDTYAISPHLAVTSHMDYLYYQSEAAFRVAKGRNRRLRDFAPSYFQVTNGGKLPLVRTVCGNLTELTEPPIEVELPLLSEDKYWHARTWNGTGSIQRLNAASLNLANWDALRSRAMTEQQSRARFVPLPDVLGSGSAAMVYLAQNRTTTYAYACVVDARWVTGETIQTDRSVMRSWESQAGYQPFDRRNSSPNFAFDRVGMFNPRYTPFYSRPIKIEQAWLDALSPPMPEASLPGNDLVMNTFEALLNQSRLASARKVGEDSIESATLLEYVLTSFTKMHGPKARTSSR